MDDDFLVDDLQLDSRTHEKTITERNLAKLKDTFENTGYKQGFDKGEQEEETLQRGFDSGFIAARDVGSRVGRVIGILSYWHYQGIDVSILVDKAKQLTHSHLFSPSIISKAASHAEIRIDSNLLEELEVAIKDLESRCK